MPHQVVDVEALRAGRSGKKAIDLIRAEETGGGLRIGFEPVADSRSAPRWAQDRF
jgi:hypothetical protein